MDCFATVGCQQARRCEQPQPLHSSLSEIPNSGNRSQQYPRRSLFNKPHFGAWGALPV